MDRKERVFSLICIAMLAASSASAETCHFAGKSAAGLVQEVPLAVRRPQHRPPETKVIKYYDIERTAEDSKLQDRLRQEFCVNTFAQIETSAGVLSSFHEHKDDQSVLLLKDKELLRAPSLGFTQALLEDKKAPSLILVDIGDGTRYVRAPRSPHILDVGVSPPFLSKDALRVMPKTHKFKGHPTDQNFVDILDVKKTTSDTFIISGLVFKENCDNVPQACEIKDTDGKPIEASYKYDRKTRTVTKIE